jgi:type II secretion system protein I
MKTAEARRRLVCTNNEKGFTLLEILVALAIMGIAAVATFQLFSESLKKLSVSEDYIAATITAEARMEQVLDDDELAEGAWTETTKAGYRFDCTVSETLKEHTEQLPVQLLEVVLAVHWTKNGKEKALTLRTAKLISRKV